MKKKTKKKKKIPTYKQFEVYGTIESGYVLTLNCVDQEAAKEIAQRLSVNQWIIGGQMDSRAVNVLWCREKVKEKKCRKQKQ